MRALSRSVAKAPRDVSREAESEGSVTDIEFIAQMVQHAEYTGEPMLTLRVERVRSLLREYERLSRIVDEYRSRETLPTLGFGGRDVE